MDNQSAFRQSQNIDANCYNLECKNEQLKILIQKLHKISNQRNELFSSISKHVIPQNNPNELFLNNSIFDELKNAKEDNKNLEKKILNLKNQIES